ncbi:helix-turn-helix domain-containing protein [Chitinophaga nivalis]|uniref:Helix-turn-helix domain-containing protein n=1 Tax=Chitinophaga nivalis TaxID=2991709 RepID=A0ABT3IFI6_9BACT|nr:helix-turn-helix transcriptional regulator [Chitinophaga nivalis]MCW3467585.1 helix-turn-helix domain-containing protein [Chitinophaga nivalis]MCW3482723.1 helix-turn-helix domain-containing protein [Chitinophaga nivalis]
MVADMIRRLRIERNLTQEYLAHELDISQNAYCKIENGQVNITVDRLEKIAAILQTPLTTLFTCHARQEPAIDTWQEMKSMIAVLQEELQAKQKVVDTLLEVIREWKAGHPLS